MWSFWKIIQEITAGAYLISISEIVNSVQKIGASALLITNNYILALILGNDSIYPFVSHSLFFMRMAICRVLVQKFF